MILYFHLDGLIGRYWGSSGCSRVILGHGFGSAVGRRRGFNVMGRKERVLGGLLEVD